MSKRARQPKAKKEKKQGGAFNRYLRNVLYLYDDLISTWQVKNQSIYARSIPKRNDRLGVDFSGTHNGDNITYYYVIEAMPRVLNLDYRNMMRADCREGVRVTFLDAMRGHGIDWSSAQMKSRLRFLRQARQNSDNQEVDAYNWHDNVGSMNRQAWVEASLKYLAEADRARRRALLNMATMVVISGKRGEDFDESVKAIEETAKRQEVKLRRVLYDIPDLLAYFSPFSRNNKKGVSDRVPSQVLTDEIAARFNSYTQGTLGTRGIYWGTDVNSNFPVLKVVKTKEDKAENWVVTAETGGGKSHLIKMLILQLSALNYNGTIMDIEGFEYIPLANVISRSSEVRIINMAEGSGNYFDPVEIAALTGNEELDKDSKKMSMNFTLAVFKTLLGGIYHSTDIMEDILNDAVGQTYLRAGVLEERHTWANSVGLTLHSVYQMYKTLLEERYRENEDYLDGIERAITRLSRYFEPEGTRSNMMRSRISVSQIVTAKLVVCSFGMAGRSQDEVDETQLALMQLSAAQISHQRSIFSKAQGLFNYKVWEEFQRWGKFPGSENTIGVAVTGGRKLGDVNIIVTNKVSELLGDDKFGIFQNVTSFLVGAISDEKIRRELCERLSIPNMKPELDEISKAARVNDELEGDVDNVEAPLTYAFLCCLDRSKYGVVKAVLPRALKRSNMFKTGVDLKGRVEK